MAERITYRDSHGEGRLELVEADGSAHVLAKYEHNLVLVDLTPDALERLARDAAAMAKRLRRVEIAVYDIPFHEDPTT